ncbi:hypothetical protein F-M6_0390 [Faustovirus]|nr:hypothetical protein F-LCD7_0385 [Faustovirus]QJX72153.1 hypothetical protein F-M6_0390 [Faustovirus]QJX73144.1 hypothetical protein F-VV57_0383 [Faustovirus]QJX73651.1 hypothetical protein F-VV63_0385 [Faustovirus]
MNTNRYEIETHITRMFKRKLAEWSTATIYYVGIFMIVSTVFGAAMLLIEMHKGGDTAPITIKLESNTTQCINRESQSIVGRRQVITYYNVEQVDAYVAQVNAYIDKVNHNTHGVKIIYTIIVIMTVLIFAAEWAMWRLTDFLDRYD